MASVKERELTVDIVRHLLDYNEETGIFRWRYDMRRVPSNGVAGMVCHDGYIRIGLNKRQYSAHRLAWFYVYGEWPEKEIDHINRDRADNRISNLRDVSRSENIANTPARAYSKTGIKGCHEVKSGRFCAQIKVRGKGISLGTFLTLEEASAAYTAAKRIYFSNLFPKTGNAAEGPGLTATRQTQWPYGFFGAPA